MTQQTPEGDFYSRLYVEPGAPKDDSKRFRNRVGAFFVNQVHGGASSSFPPRLGEAVEIETGYQGFTYYYKSEFERFFQSSPLVDVFTAITLIWRHLGYSGRGSLASDWQKFIERVLNEENLKYRVDSKCGIHPFVDREFDRSRVSTIACLADNKYAAVRHAAEAAFDRLNEVPMDGKAAARSIFEAAESLVKTVTGSGAALTEAMVDRELRPLCDRIFANDAQLKTTAARLLSSFGKWVDGIHPYRHGHERDQPLVLPDDLAILAISQGAAFIRWLVDVDHRRGSGNR